MRMIPVSDPPMMEMSNVVRRAANWYPPCTTPVRVKAILSSHGMVSFQARAGKTSHKLKHVIGTLMLQGVTSVCL